MHRESKSKTIVLVIDYDSKLSVGHQVLMGWDKNDEAIRACLDKEWSCEHVSGTAAMLVSSV